MFDIRKTDERVRQRAYYLWEKDGRPHGRNDHYWALALQQIRDEDREQEVTSESPSPPRDETMTAH